MRHCVSAQQVVSEGDSVGLRDRNRILASPDSFLFIIILFYLSIVDLQCCVNFCCTAKVIQLYIYMCFFVFFSIMVYQRILTVVPCAIQYDLVVYPFYI